MTTENNTKCIVSSCPWHSTSHTFTTAAQSYIMKLTNKHKIDNYVLGTQNRTVNMFGIFKLCI